MRLNEILAIIREMDISDRPDICADSRRVKKGDVFVAIKGTRFDGHDFIAEAVENGASFIVCEKPLDINSVETVLAANSNIAVGQLSQQRYDCPSQKLTNLAVTGTNGKTTVSFLVQSVIAGAGKKIGLVGTIITDTANDEQTQSAMTTPDAISLAELSAKMVDARAEYMVIEASSHAIDQGRLSGIDFSAAAFTNLTGDHLDYHKTMENYLAAKTKLFSHLTADSYAVINIDDAAGLKIAAATQAKTLFYGIDRPAELSAEIKSMDITGSVFELRYRGQCCEVRTGLPGKHNVSNHLAAAGLCIAAGFELPVIARGLSGLAKVSGRLERVEHGGDFSVLIDYAHTDDALENVLTTLKPLCRNRLCVLFGCGGDRDRSKRPRMAKTVQRFADRIIVTSDNPRSEKPEDIISDIFKGFDRCEDADIKTFTDRGVAIESAIKEAQAGDIILIAGKGHESYQVIGHEKMHFSDTETARRFLRCTQ